MDIPGRFALKVNCASFNMTTTAPAKYNPTSPACPTVKGTYPFLQQSDSCVPKLTPLLLLLLVRLRLRQLMNGRGRWRDVRVWKREER